MSYIGMEVDSPGTSEGHTEGSTSMSGSNTNNSANGNAELSEGVRRRFSFEIGPDSFSVVRLPATTVLSPRRTQANEFFGVPTVPSYPRGFPDDGRPRLLEEPSQPDKFSESLSCPGDLPDGDRPRFLEVPSRPDSPSYESRLVFQTNAESTEPTVTELPGASVIQSPRHLPTHELGNEIWSEVVIDHGKKAITTIRTESMEPGPVELPEVFFITDKDVDHMTGPSICSLRGGNPFQRDLEVSPRVWERVLHVMFHVLTHELYLPCCHLLTLFQVVLIILQEVPDTANTTPKWDKTHLATHYLLVAIFTIYTIDIIMWIAVIWPIAWQNSVSQRRSFRKRWDRWLSEEARKYLNCLFSGPEDEIADNTIGKSSDSRNRSIWERNMDIFSPSTRRKQLSRDRQESIISGAIQEQLHMAFGVITVMAFWISTALENHGFATNSAASAFRMVSSLRILTLLGISRGTQVHFQSAFSSKNVRISNRH